MADGGPFSLSGHFARINFRLTVAFTVLATVSVALRLYCRRLRRFAFALDDWLIIAALVTYFGFMVARLFELFRGHAGEHRFALSRDQLVAYGKAEMASELLYAVSTTLTRISICYFFSRLFPVKWYLRAVYANMALCVCCGLFYFLSFLFRCHPISKSWDPAITEGFCYNVKSIEMAVPIWNLICDSLTWILPLPVVWRLKMSVHYKVAVTLIFTVGLMYATLVANTPPFRIQRLKFNSAIAIDAVRIQSISRINVSDISHSNVIPSCWTFMECGILIMCACAPTYRPVLDSLLSAARLCDKFITTCLDKSRRPGLHTGKFQSSESWFSGGRISPPNPESKPSDSLNVKEEQISVCREISVTESRTDERYLGQFDASMRNGRIPEHCPV